MGTDPFDLQDLCEQFLSAVLESLNSIPDFDASYLGAPDRYFVSVGPPAFDCCDLATVHVSELSEGAAAPIQPKASIARINHVTLVATFTRCVPTLDSNGEPPSASDLWDSSRQLNADKWAVWNHIYNMINAGDLFDKCCDVIWGSLLTVQPSGGCAGSTLSVTVCFDGYEEIPST